MTSSGKTVFTKKLLTEPGFIYPEPEDIMYFYTEDQPIYKEMPSVKFIEGLPTRDIYDDLSPNKRHVMVIDDNMVEALKCEFVSSLFTRGSHHRSSLISSCKFLKELD